jgi:hypothetical protein
MRRATKPADWDDEAQGEFDPYADSPKFSVSLVASGVMKAERS